MISLQCCQITTPPAPLLVTRPRSQRPGHGVGMVRNLYHVVLCPKPAAQTERSGPACCHVVMLSCCHAVMLSCCHAVMLSCCHVVMLSCCHVVMLSCCHVLSVSLLRTFPPLALPQTTQNLDVKMRKHWYEPNDMSMTLVFMDEGTFSSFSCGLRDGQNIWNHQPSFVDV